MTEAATGPLILVVRNSSTVVGRADFQLSPVRMPSLRGIATE